MPSDALQHLSGLLKKFDGSVTKDQLKTELLDFARKWENFQTTFEDEYNLIFEMEVTLLGMLLFNASLYVFSILCQGAIAAEKWCCEWRELGHKRIYFSNELISYEDARARCRKMNSTLLSVENNEILDALNKEWPDFEYLFFTSYVVKHSKDCLSQKIKENNKLGAGAYYCILSKNATTKKLQWNHEIKEPRRYICETHKKDRKISYKETTFLVSSTETLTSIIPTESHVEENNVSFIVALAISSGILIIAILIASIIVFETKANKKKRKQQLRLEKHGTDVFQPHEDDIGTYDSIKYHISTIEIKQKDKSTTELNANLTTPDKSFNTNFEPVHPSQETNKIDEGRYLNEEGLVYVTVNHAQQSVNLTVVNKPDTEENEVVYATIIHWILSQIE
ncbi:hypothetical protein Bpfe_003499 [Biomphalaria pfeifferi]|uniref:C-type lectin domain-containing protein n=1 Tax=Biomphalaria pfeifferi TaxID=112525 RepID=A0AAD8C5D6_BIOPF|nr:hypothetical protein Bpfe_003499 [Biomphalaria pfeifferi]